MGLFRLSLGQYPTLLDHGSPNETHLPLSPSPKGGGGTQAAAPVTPSPPLGAERAGVRWGFLGPHCMKSENVQKLGTIPSDRIVL